MNQTQSTATTLPMKLSKFSPRIKRQKQHQSTLCLPYRQLEIAGQMYRLTIIPLDRGHTWRWQIQNLIPERFIPGGFKLRILTEIGAVLGEAVANSVVKELKLDINPPKGSGVIWEIEPIPEDYCAEIWHCEAVES